MFNRFIIVAVSAVFLVSGAGYAETKVTVDDKEAIAFFKSSQVVILKQAIDSSELAGCLILHKEGKTDQYLNILPESVKKGLKQKNLTNVMYRTMLSEKEAAGLEGFLGLFGFTATKDSLFETEVKDIWMIDGPTFVNSPAIKSKIIEYGKMYTNQGYTVEYNPSVKFSVLTMSRFQKDDKKVKMTLTYVGASGESYVQNSNYMQKEMISIAPIDVSPLIKPGGFEAKSLGTDKGMHKTKKVYKNTIMKLQPANPPVLKNTEKKISK